MSSSPGASLGPSSAPLAVPRLSVIVEHSDEPPLALAKRAPMPSAVYALALQAALSLALLILCGILSGTQSDTANAMWFYALSVLLALVAAGAIARATMPPALREGVCVACCALTIAQAATASGMFVSYNADLRVHDKLCVSACGSKTVRLRHNIWMLFAFVLVAVIGIRAHVARWTPMLAAMRADSRAASASSYLVSPGVGASAPISPRRA